MPLQFFAACPRNVADLLAGELRALGIEVQREHPAGVSFSGPLRAGYAACLHSRTASRILLSLGEVAASTPDEFYQGVRGFDWEAHLRGEGSIAIDVVGQPPTWLRDTRFAAMKA